MGTQARARRHLAVGTPCFLCGRTMAAGERTNREHIPAKSYFPKAIRKQFNPELDCLQVHESCNTALKLDEEYFLAAFGPAAGSDALVGRALLDDLRTAYRDDPNRRRLGEMVLREFGVVQAIDGSRVKYYDAGRANVVLWKIVRGLAFLETQGSLLLRADAPKSVIICPTPESIETHGRPILDEFVQLPAMGKHRRVLDYRVHSVVEFAAGRLEMAGQAWALLLWNRIIAFVMFHVPVCPCSMCDPRRQVL